VTTKHIPITAAKRIADAYGQSQVVIVTFDKDGGGITHVVTYGRTLEECKQAAEGGNFVKRALGWPESAMSVPARAKRTKPKKLVFINALTEDEPQGRGGDPYDD
jgi:hypothetical protein